MEIYKNMSKICTSIEQSQRLIELGIDVKTADMCYRIVAYNPNDTHVYQPYCFVGTLGSDISAWSLSALLELIPDKISINNESYYLSFEKKSVAFRGPITWDGQKAKSFEMDNILDAVFEMICWLKKEKYI